MPKIIAVAGKGGTGKTTLSGLIIMNLVKQGKKPVLAIDADPNNCLNEVLGLDFEKTVVSLADDLMAEKDSLPQGLTKERHIELNFQKALVESSGFDLIVMGHPEREGCYCAANNMLKNCMDDLGSNYAYAVIDNEAGMEHLSRRTARKIDHLVILANPTPLSMKSASRISSIARDLKLEVRNTWTVVNALAGTTPEDRAVDSAGITARIPYDEEIYRLAVKGDNIFNLGENSKAYRAVSSLLLKIGI